MEDQMIIDLYWKRSEQAITETDQKYGRFCYGLAHNVLGSREDAEESVSDTYFAAWKAMPPCRPAMLMAFLAKITRRISVDKFRARTAEKRGGGQVQAALEELWDCASQDPDPEEVAMGRELYACLNRFLDTLPETERTVFLRRYFLLDTAAQIGKSFGFTESKVTSMLHRTRLKLKTYLKKSNGVMSR